MPRRSHLLPAVIAAGVAGGAAGAVFVGLLHLTEKLLWPTHSGLFVHGLLLVGVGVAVAVLTKALGKPGDVELLVDNIHLRGGPEDLQALRSLLPISLLCIGVGAAVGPEAPMVQTTGSLGSYIATRWRLSRSEARIVTISGMAAGLSVLFGAPLGAAVFALEILHRRGLEYYEALLPAVLGSLAGYAVYVTVTGMGLQPVWVLPAATPLHGGDLFWAVGCGAAGAAVAATMSRLLEIFRLVAARVPASIGPAIGGLALALLAWVSPYALTYGEDQLGHVAVTDLALRTLALAVVVKLVACSVTLGTGWRGGFIIPLFFIGATMGRAGHVMFPHANQVVLISALMAACNVGVTKTPVGSVLVVTEMAGLQLLPTTLIASIVSLALTSRVGIIHTQRQRPSEGAESTTTDDG